MSRILTIHYMCFESGLWSSTCSHVTSFRALRQWITILQSVIMSYATWMHPRDGWFVTVGLWNATRFGFNFGNSIIVGKKTVHAQLRHDISMRSPIVLVPFCSHENVATQMHWGHLLDLVMGPGCAMAFTPPWWVGCLGTKPRTIRWRALEADWLRSVMWFGLWNLGI